MVSPVELTKLGVRARIHRLGPLKYILIASFLLLILGATEIWRYNEYRQCIETSTKTDSEDRKGLIELVIDIVKGDQTLTNERKTQLIKETMKSLGTIYAASKCDPRYRYDVFRLFSWFIPISPAYAQMKIGGYSESEIRGIVIVSIFSCMGVFFFVSTGALLFSKSAKVVAFAMDSVKTLLGFFIGVAMTFMGVH